MQINDMPDVPDEETVGAMAREILADSALVSRFPTGLRHFVFQVASAQGKRIVVRVSRREDVSVVRDSIYWSDMLRPLEIPLPELLYADATMSRHPYPFVILERLPGRDLEFVIGDLSREALGRLVRRLSDLQTIVAELPLGQGYGFAARLEGPFAHDSWNDSIAGSLARCRKQIRSASILSERYADRVEAVSERLVDYFAEVPPVPFLHDITTKNVIVHDAHLSGIVDVDDLCFGDPLFLIGLIRVALLANDHNLEYADAWLDVLRPDRNQREALDFYTALFCLDFMAELGHRFNRAEPAPVEIAYIEHLKSFFDYYLVC
ncbi:MAG: aminoglycoside phosphotransferase family protein [Pseudomonadota bacterium]